MSPISRERAKFCQDRIKLLTSMNFELTRQRHLFGARPSEIQRVMDQVLTERLSLQLEEELITDFLDSREKNAKPT